MPNRDAAIYRFTQLTTSQTYPAAPVHLPGLDPERTYRVSPLDPSLDLTGLTNGQSTLGWWNEEGVVLTPAKPCSATAFVPRPSTPSRQYAQGCGVKLTA